MDLFSRHDLRQLVETSQEPCVTICMPTHVSGSDAEQDELRLKNLADHAEQQLADGWLRAPEARALMAAVRDIPADREFWTERSRGLALFSDRGALRRFRVPIPLEELVLVGRQFHLSSLLPLLSSRRFLVLALSQHNVCLFEATQYQIEPIEVAGLPQRLDETLNLVSVDRGSQSHFGMKGGKGKETSVFHGQGGIKETHKDELSLFFRMIDDALKPVLREESAPMILAGVEYLLPLFRNACHYPQVAAAELHGNCDHLSAQQIQQKVWPLVEPLLDEHRQRAADKYHQLVGTGLAADDIGQLLPAAYEGRIETLFIVPSRRQWGACDQHGRVLAIHDAQEPGDEDLPDLAATQTLLHGGQVHAVSRDEMPSGEPVAAVLRY